MSDSIIWRDIEAFAVFSMCVAGKNGPRTERAVETFLERRGGEREGCGFTLS